MSRLSLLAVAGVVLALTVSIPAAVPDPVRL
jgi:hypothetical protein